MSQENLEVVKAAHAAAAAGDFDGWLAFLHPEVEWDTTASHFVEGGRRYEGHAGVRSYFQSWFSAWDEYEVTVDELLAVGDEVIAVLNERGISRTTGIPLDQHPAMIWTIRDELAVRVRVFDNGTDALDAVGLSDRRPVERES